MICNDVLCWVCENKEVVASSILNYNAYNDYELVKGWALDRCLILLCQKCIDDMNLENSILIKNIYYFE